MVTAIIPARELSPSDVIVERPNPRRKPTLTKIRDGGVSIKPGCGVHVVTMEGAVWCYQPEAFVEVKL